MPTWGEILQELQQTPAVPGRPHPCDVVRRKYLAQLAAYTKRSVILYATKWTQGGSGADPDVTSLSIEDVQGFMEVVRNLPSGGLDLVLHSPGGSPEATEAIVKYLRSKFDDIRVFIPHAAMSAATMLACSANRIVMGRHSFLGPIDPQFIMQTEVGRSAIPAHAIIEQFRLAQKECRDPALLPSWLPILRQFGPALIVQCKLAMQLSEELVSQWLEKYMFAGKPTAKASADNAAKQLADHGQFKSHGRFLARDEIRALEILVDDLESDQNLQDGVLSVYHAMTHTMLATPVVKVIENHLGKSFLKQHIPQGPQVFLPRGVPLIAPAQPQQPPPAGPPQTRPGKRPA